MNSTKLFKLTYFTKKVFFLFDSINNQEEDRNGNMLRGNKVMRGGYIGRVFRVVVNEQQEEKARIVAVEGDLEYELGKYDREVV